MPDSKIIPEAVFEVVEPDGSRSMVQVTRSPFLIGRGIEEGNHLRLGDKRISRRAAALVRTEDGFRLEDRGQRNGVLVNGEQVETCLLRDADTITFGSIDSVQLIFHPGTPHESVPELLSRLDQAAALEPGARTLRQLSLLLEATALLQSHMPVEDVLGAMVDRALAITEGERGLLLQAEADESLKPMVARQRGSKSLPLLTVSPSQTAIAQALKQRRGVVAADVAQASALKDAKSVVAQQLKSIVAIPWLSLTHLQPSDTTSVGTSGELLGVLYLDSPRPAAFSALDRKILDAFAAEAASVLDKARLIQKEQERRRFEQELSIAREIQQALLPKGFHHYPHFQVTGVNRPCLAVGGDYFDLMELGGDRTALVIADVSGKGLGAALVTAMLQGTFSAMTLGQDPSKVFAHVNRFICDHSEVGRYATLFFGILEKSGRLDYINAGHLPPLLVHEGKVESVFQADSFPLGMFPHAEFKPASHTLAPGDTLVLSTDGVKEAMNLKEEEFGMERLQDVIAQTPDAPIGELETSILSSVEKFTGGAAQADDLTLLILRYVGAGQPQIPAP